MRAFLDQAVIILAKIASEKPEFKQAHEHLSGLIKPTNEKVAGADGAIITNVINLLTPFVVNYKVNQVMKLMKELAKDQKNQIGLKDEKGITQY